MTATITVPAATPSPTRLSPSLPAPTPTPECRVVTLTGDQHEAWNAYVHAHADASIFHTLNWRDAVQATFGLRPLYLLALRDEALYTAAAPSGPGPAFENTRPVVQRVVGVLPMFMVDSRLGGRALVSVPYAVDGGVIADRLPIAQALLGEARCIAENENCAWIDLRGRKPVFPDLPIHDGYVTFERELPSTGDDVLAWLPRKARAAARNGRDRFRLTYDAAVDGETNCHLPTVWHMYTLNMRRLASIAYPYRFFAELIAAFPVRTWVCSANRKGRPVAGLVTFLFRDRVIPYFYGATRDARRCSAANFLYFETMKRAADEGFRVFDFGRSRRDNSGSFDFKRFHGFEPQPLGYQACPVSGGSARRLTPTDKRFGFVRRIWPLLPLKATHLAGRVLSPHIPG